MTIRILLADDHSVVRQGLRMFLSLDPEFDVVGEAPDGAEAVKMARELQPDVVLKLLNGIGFESDGTFPGHMGLVSMRERAASIGARLNVKSVPGDGTSITLEADRPA